MSPFRCFNRWFCARLFDLINRESKLEGRGLVKPMCHVNLYEIRSRQQKNMLKNVIASGFSGVASPKFCGGPKCLILGE